MKLVTYIASLIWLVAIAAAVLALRSPAADGGGHCPLCSAVN